MVYLIFAIAFGVIGVASFVGAWLKRSKRASLAMAVFAAGVAAISAYTHVFWPVPVFGLVTLWALFGALGIMNQGWRLKVGLATCMALGAALALFPTVHDEILCSEERESTPDSCPDKIDAMDAEAKAAFQEAAEEGDKGVRHFLLSNIPFRMVRGLDLKGGLRLVYTVDVEEAIKDKRDRYYDDLRRQLTKAYKLNAGEEPTVEEMQKLNDHLSMSKPRAKVDTIFLKFNNPADSKQHINDKFLTHFLGGLSIVRATDGSEITFKIRNEVGSGIRERAVVQAKETINRRIDGMGVKEAAISVRDEDIIVEIPGTDERHFEEIRDIISQTARLEFKLLDDEVNFFEKYASAEDLPEGIEFLVENAPIGPGKTQPNFYAQLKSLKGETLEDALKRMKAWTTTLPMDEDHDIGFGKFYQVDEETEQYKAVGWRSYYLRSKAELTGDMVRDAAAMADQSDTGFGQWYVNMTLTPRGAELFEQITEANVKKRFAIILDNKVESAPEIREKIGGGQARITMGAGGIQQQNKDATKLELVLRSGALPAPISPTNEQRIGPSLGRDAIDLGMKAAGLGGLLVFVLMLVSYRRAGLIANFAVFFNLTLQLAVLAMFSASMTLPGIAGLALTVGMAVDANVLINERIKEELSAGKIARAAVSTGYDKAFSAIIDGNATTLISGLILAQYGTGPIKGFAVTLIVGMLCNLFTGVVVTRLFFEFWVRGRRNVKLGLGGEQPA